MVVSYTTMEGDFYELNLTPRMHLTDAFEVLFWYRFVSTNRQSYVGPSDKTSVESTGKKSGSWELFRPTAEYTATSNDCTLQANWTPIRNLNAFGRVTVRKSVTQYYEDKNGVDNLNYAGLLDRAGDDWTRYAVGIKTEF